MGERGRVPAIALGFLSVAYSGYSPARAHRPPRAANHAAGVHTGGDVRVGCSAASPALAGALTALSLAISIENLPFFVVLYAAVASGKHRRWSRSHHDVAARRRARGRIARLLRRNRVTCRAIGSCDAFSAAHIFGGLTGAAAFAGLALALPRGTLRGRVVATAVAGGLVLLADFTYPACLGDPLAQVDPFVKEVWLATVSEATPLSKVMDAAADVAHSVHRSCSATRGSAPCGERAEWPARGGLS